MELLEILEQTISELRGPYGITWYVDDHAIAQTGFVFDIADAREYGRIGPWGTEKVTQVDALCEHYPEDEGVQIWTIIETEDYENADEFWSEGGPIAV